VVLAALAWYLPEQQGTALGIARAGNSGTAFAALLAPELAAAFGWQNVFGLALVPRAACEQAVHDLACMPRNRARRALRVGHAAGR
jgi:nitrate/nitrite transporter NarK